MVHPQRNATAEWRQYWFLPFVAMLGYSTASLHSYAFGAFIKPIQSEFGWSRTEVSSGLVIANLGLALIIPFSGMLIDSYGPRRVALIGLPLFVAAVGSLSMATGSLVEWWAHWGFIALTTLGIQGAVWTSAVVTRFHAGRGGAVAISVSGVSVAAAILPLLTTWLIARYGWRLGYVYLTLLWLVAVWPMLFRFFRGAHEERHARSATDADRLSPPLPGLSARDAMRSGAFYKIVFLGFAAAFTTTSTVINFIPILDSVGVSALSAAGLTSLLGFMSILGRLGVGVLLDRMPAHLVGAAIYLVPLAGCAILLFSGNGTAALAMAAIAFGIALGAEADVVIYLLTAHMGLRSFGTLMSVTFGAIALGSAVGPMFASAIFDLYQGYTPFLIAVGLSTITSTIVVRSLKPPVSRPVFG